MRKNKKNMMVVLIILFIMLTILIKSNILNGFEMLFYNKTMEYSGPLVTTMMKEITILGNSTFVIILCIILLVNAKTRFKYGFITSIGVIISAISNTLLKLIFIRERPDVLKLINETSYSFPSGHAMINGTLYTLLAISIYKNIKSKRTKQLLIIICVIMPIIIGISRVYLGVHYITDVIAGWILGIVIAILVYQFIEKNKNKEI